MPIVPPPGVLADRIMAALRCATPQEIRDGLDFYPGAHGLCRALAKMHPTRKLDASAVAGIYAALSPMNGWESNVANVLDVLRSGAAARVNTSRVNLDKAVAIAEGADPAGVLRGRKVTAFWRAMADPANTDPVPVDRHLINLALGVAPGKNEQSRLASNPELYTAVEAAYMWLGAEEGIGNRLASIAWFVQRRLSRRFQLPMASLAAAEVAIAAQA